MYYNHPYLSGSIALSLLFMGIYVISKDVKSKLYQKFFFMCFFIWGWFFANAFSMYYHENFNLALLWFRIGYSSVAFMVLSFLEVAIAFLKKKRPRVLNLVYVYAVFEMIFVWLPTSITGIETGLVFIKNAGSMWTVMDYYFYYMIIGMIKYIIISSIAAYLFYVEYKEEIDPVRKQHILLQFIPFLIIILGASEWLGIFGIPLHIGWVAAPPFVLVNAYMIMKYKRIMIEPLHESNVLEKKVYDLEKGVSYLIKEERNEKSVKVFVDQVRSGKHGLYVTRSNPEIIRRRTNLLKTPMIWLTEVSGENNIDPSRIEELSYAITNFLDSAEGGVVLLEGIPYLVSFSDFNLVLRLIRTLKDTVSTKGATFIVSANPKNFDEHEFSLLQSEFEELKI